MEAAQAEWSATPHPLRLPRIIPGRLNKPRETGLAYRCIIAIACARNHKWEEGPVRPEK
jgi:hypothetical protein